MSTVTNYVFTFNRDVTNALPYLDIPLGNIAKVVNCTGVNVQFVCTRENKTQCENVNLGSTKTVMLQKHLNTELLIAAIGLEVPYSTPQFAPVFRLHPFDGGIDYDGLSGITIIDVSSLTHKLPLFDGTNAAALMTALTNATPTGTQAMVLRAFEQTGLPTDTDLHWHNEDNLIGLVIVDVYDG